MKGMHLTLESWCPHRLPEGWKQDPYGLYIDLSEYNLGGETEKSLGKFNGTPRKGAATKMVNLIRSDKCNVVVLTYRFFSDYRGIRIPRYNLCTPLKYCQPGKY